MVSALLAACGGSSSDFTASSTISLAQLPAELGKALCQAEQACNPFFYQVAFSNADCASSLAEQLQQASFTQIQNAVTAKLANYDGLKAASCVSAVANGGCSVLDNNLPAVCREALSGTVATGGECDIDAECSGVARCQITGEHVPGQLRAAGLGGRELRQQRRLRARPNLFRRDVALRCARRAERALRRSQRRAVRCGTALYRQQ